MAVDIKDVEQGVHSNVAPTGMPVVSFFLTTSFSREGSSQKLVLCPF